VQIEAAAIAPIHAGRRGGITPVILQAAQFLFEVVRRHRRADVEFERCGVDVRRYGPMPALKFAGHNAVEVRDPYGDEGRRDSDHHEHEDS
jgi:hypothetical protein